MMTSLFDSFMSPAMIFTPYLRDESSSPLARERTKLGVDFSLGNAIDTIQKSGRTPFAAKSLVQAVKALEAICFGLIELGASVLETSMSALNITSFDADLFVNQRHHLQMGQKKAN